MPEVSINISIDWEGNHLHNISDLAEVRKNIGEHIPVTHFICPSYFLSQPKWKADMIKSLIFEGDEVALHLHCWKKLIKNVPGVEFRETPDFYTPQSLTSLIKRRLFGWNDGRGVPLSAYSPSEIRKILDFSVQLLKDYLPVTHEIKGFRAGGWIASDEVLKALSELGYGYDASAVPPALLSQGYGAVQRGNYIDAYGKANGAFTDFVLNLWGYTLHADGVFKNTAILEQNNRQAIVPLHQPFQVYELWEMPNNLGMSDYVSFKDTLLPALDEAVNIVASEGRSILYSTGCHQEGGYEFKTPLIRFMQSLSPKNEPYIQYRTLKDIYTG